MCTLVLHTVSTYFLAILWFSHKLKIIIDLYFLFPLCHPQQSCDPYFLTTVVFPDGAMNELTRLKLAVFDVRDREKEEVFWKLE